MILLSEAKVASMWESKGEAARRRRGCVGAKAVDLEGEEADGEAAMEIVLASSLFMHYQLELTLIILLRRLVDDCGVL